MSKRSWLFFGGAALAGVLVTAAYFFFPADTKDKHCMHDEETYLSFCREAALQPALYTSFRSHPLYTVFQESLNETSAGHYLTHLEKQYPHLLLENELIASLDAIGNPLKIARPGTQEISYPTLRNLKIEGDVEKFFGSLTGKTVVQIGASDGSLCKILKTFHQPSRYCIIDIAPALSLAQKTLADWNIGDVEFYTPEEFIAPDSIDLVISPFVFAESRRNIQQFYLTNIMRHARQGYLECRFPMRHFGLKVWTQEQILERLEGIGKRPQLVVEEPLTDIDHCLILFAL